jgi:DNA-binding transcriptional regulator GbsR (MarR family)
MYLKAKDIMEKYQIGRSTVSKIIAEMLEANRYPASAIIGDTCRRVDSEAFQDYMENRSLLKHPNMKRYVKPYKGDKK